eukprot:2756838-Alexandrium_andersonii.AAC.1
MKALDYARTTLCDDRSKPTVGDSPATLEGVCGGGCPGKSNDRPPHGLSESELPCTGWGRGDTGASSTPGT